MTFFFWISLGLIFYVFIGYGILLFILLRIKGIFASKTLPNINNYIPSCSIVIAAYNEEDFIRNKISNTLSLKYPKELLKIYIVADGSTDRTTQIVKDYPDVNLLFQPERKGKAEAINRAMKIIDSEIVVFTDANTFLNTDALLNIGRHYSIKNVGGVAGEKRIHITKEADASTTGESFYWRYESKLKHWDSLLNSTIGAAGELFSIRTPLYEPISKDIILDDFMISMSIAQKGFRIIYEPNAYAMELSSSNVKEELKRKIRIAAGGIQSIIKLKKLLNPFPNPLLSFQFFSHRVLRWTIIPFLLVIVLLVNIQLAFETNHFVYNILLTSQATFYFLSIIGYFLEKKHLRIKIAFIPYYFCMMNYAIILGIIQYFNKQQNSIWEKVKRKESLEDTKYILNKE